MNQEQFWKTRSRKFNNLKWANEHSYIKMLICSGDFKKNDIVLDVGTGTGIIAHAISPLVKKVIGMDISQDMIEHSDWNGFKYFIKGDIRDPYFYDNIFDKVVARMVFHHITEGIQGAMDECYRILKNGGKMILAEGIPPIQKLGKNI